MKRSYVLGCRSDLERHLTGFAGLLFVVLRDVSMYRQRGTGTSRKLGHAWAIFWVSRRESSTSSGHTRASRCKKNRRTRNRGKKKRTRIVSYFRPGRSQHMRESAFVLTWNNIPSTTARSWLVPEPMRLAMGSSPPHSLHLRPRHALTGCVRPRAEMTTSLADPGTTPDTMGFGDSYPERSDSRHAPVIIIQGGNHI